MPDTIFFLKADTPFRFLVTVMLSASSTDKMALQSAGKLFAAYPDEKSLSEAAEDDIEALIHSSGLSRTKARNIKGVAREVVLHGLPTDRKGLEALPGVGEKTASCFLSTIMGEPAVVVDTHFSRVANRLGFTSTTDRTKAAQEIRLRFPQDKWNRLSDTVNLLGRTTCRPKPQCEACIVSSLCPSSVGKAEE